MIKFLTLATVIALVTVWPHQPNEAEMLKKELARYSCPFGYLTYDGIELPNRFNQKNIGIKCNGNKPKSGR